MSARVGALKFQDKNWGASPETEPTIDPERLNVITCLAKILKIPSESKAAPNSSTQYKTLKTLLKADKTTELRLATGNWLCNIAA